MIMMYTMAQGMLAHQRGSSMLASNNGEVKKSPWLLIFMIQLFFQFRRKFYLFNLQLRIRIESQYCP